MPSNQNSSLPIKAIEHESIVAYFRASPDIEPSIIKRLNIERMFILIDGILPIEACLYYQVLPLFLEGSRLNLGMVSPSDTAATDYVRRLVSYLNYSLVTHKISSEALRASLTAYLRHSDETTTKSEVSAEPSAASRRAKRLSDRENAPQTFDASAQPTLVVDSPDDLDTAALNLGEVSFDEDIDWAADDLDTITIGLFDETSSEAQTTNTSPSSALNTSAPNTKDDPVAPPVAVDAESTDREKLSQMPDIPVLEDDPEDDVDADIEQESRAEIPSSSTQEAIKEEPNAISVDDVQPIARSDDSALSNESASNESAQESLNQSAHRQSMTRRYLRYVSDQQQQGPNGASPPSGLLRSPIQLNLEPVSTYLEISELSRLPAAALLTDLLVRTLDRGIGRLYFERQELTGRILWSEDGILQQVIEGLPAQKFIQVIEALKALTKLPINPSDKPIQVELERMYQNERILLRFRFVPSFNGEEATLQVLRGAALRFYQRQQVSKLSKDAITTAQALQNKVNALRDRLIASSDRSDEQANVLPTLAAMIDQIEGQLDDLEDMMK